MKAHFLITVFIGLVFGIIVQLAALFFTHGIALSTHLLLSILMNGVGSSVMITICYGASSLLLCIIGKVKQKAI